MMLRDNRASEAAVLAVIFGAVVSATSCSKEAEDEIVPAAEVVVDPSRCSGGNPIERTTTMTFNGVEFTMVAVPAGSFLMGIQSDDPSAAAYDEVATEFEKPIHTVRLSAYAIGETEVTQELWKAVVGQSPIDGAKQWSNTRGRGDKFPAYNVSYYDIVNRFLPKLNSANLLPTGMEFVVPTEAEWEFAAQGGERTDYIRYAGSDVIDEVAWYYDNAGQTTHEVKTKKPNSLGIYDMTGNIWEWTADFYDYYDGAEQTDPMGAATGVDYVIRGGSFDTGAARSVIHARVYSDYPASRNEYLGFRIAVRTKK